MKMWRLNIVLAGLLILSATLLAHAMIPHKSLGKAPSQQELEAMIPEAFGQWTPDASVRMVEPPGSDSLSHQVYNAELSRGYRDAAGNLVMLVVAYGASQSDRLQLHRPEICYAAQGFRVSKSKTFGLPGDVDPQPLAVRRLIAQREGRLEPITYWMRIGDNVATGSVERQILKVQYGLNGYVTDGALIRISTIGLPEDKAFALQTDFIRDLLKAITPETHRFLVGDHSKSIAIGL